MAAVARVGDIQWPAVGGDGSGGAFIPTKLCCSFGILVFFSSRLFACSLSREGAPGLLEQCHDSVKDHGYRLSVVDGCGCGWFGRLCLV